MKKTLAVIELHIKYCEDQLSNPNELLPTHNQIANKKYTFMLEALKEIKASLILESK